MQSIQQEFRCTKKRSAMLKVQVETMKLEIKDMVFILHLVSCSSAMLWSGHSAEDRAFSVLPCPAV